MTTILSTPPERLIKARIAKILFGHTNFATCLYCSRTGCVRRDEKYQCMRCKRSWTLTSLTWMKGMKLGWSQFWKLLSSYAHKIPIDQTQRLINVSKPTIYRWFELFRNNLPDLEDVRLEGVVQMDEAYFGRKKTGVAVVAARQKGSKKVAAVIIPKSSVNREDIMPFLRQFIIPGSTLYTDGAAIYRGIGKHWPVTHDYDIHRKAEFGKTSVIEGFFGSFRTFIRRMYHHVTTIKLPKLLKEYCCRMMHKEIFDSPSSLLPILLPKFPFA